MSKFYKQYFSSENQSYSIVIEDNGRVAYAYLLEGNRIVSDVWLYNHAIPPEKSNWSNKKEMPFLNPKEFLFNDKEISPINDESEVKIEWLRELDTMFVHVYIRNILFVVLRPDLFPGYSTLVTKNGPLARVFTAGSAIVCTKNKK